MYQVNAPMIKKFYINQDGKAKVLLISKEDKKTIIGILEVNLKMT